MSHIRLSLLLLLAACVGFIVLCYPAASFSVLAGSLVAISTSSTLIFFGLVTILLFTGTNRRSTYVVEQAEPTFVRRSHG
ncbi:hypothetical protein ACT6QG_06960 [Xanthobacter sp. TB0136]|uniref:hypothetical protein n=1 Tax=Xanthobacter sp. TB0136 TaxID=3459177 RepID=UPI00403A386A